MTSFVSLEADGEGRSAEWGKEKCDWPTNRASDLSFIDQLGCSIFPTQNKISVLGLKRRFQLFAQ